jgi:hypothetical protein
MCRDAVHRGFSERADISILRREAGLPAYPPDRVLLILGARRESARSRETRR